MEAKLIADMEKADRAKVYRAIMEQGGLKTRADLREEDACIPNPFKRKVGPNPATVARGREVRELSVEGLTVALQPLEGDVDDFDTSEFTTRKDTIKKRASAAKGART